MDPDTSEALRQYIEYALETQPRRKAISQILAMWEVFYSNAEEIGRIEERKRDKRRAIEGALKSTIDAHGPISGRFINSAVKRILGALRTEIYNYKQ